MAQKQTTRPGDNTWLKNFYNTFKMSNLLMVSEITNFSLVIHQIMIQKIKAEI